MSHFSTTPVIRSAGFFRPSPKVSASYVLDQGSLFLSGPTGQGKEALQQLLTGWHMQTSDELLSDSSMILWYAWEGKDSRFLTFHASSGKKGSTMFVSGLPEESWQEEPFNTLEEWQAIFKREGRKTSKFLAKEEYLRWLQHQKNPLSTALQKRFPSPRISATVLRLLTFQPDPTPQAWERFWADPLIVQSKVSDPLKSLILEYANMRTSLRREEEMAVHLPQLRKWHNQSHHLTLEEASLSAQFPAVKTQHQKDGAQLRAELEVLHSTDQQGDRLDSLRNRIGWIEWQLEQTTTEKGKPVSSPVLWWQARKILDREKEGLQQQVDALISQFSQEKHYQEEETAISDRLKQMEKTYPDKVSSLERSKMKLEWLRKEKAREEQLQKEVQQSTMNRLIADRERIEASLADHEQEAKRPRNTFRHWLEKHVPEWEKGPGKLLHPQVLESRGMFPNVERINDLFYGIRLHLEDLPEPESGEKSGGNSGRQLENIRQQISDAQIQFLHEEKLLQNRYKQKSRQIQKAIQQAEYDLQLHDRESSRLRLKMKELGLLASQHRHKSQLDLQYQIAEIQKQISVLVGEIELLDTSWEAYLHEESEALDHQQLHSLKASWKKELTSLERKQKKDAKEKEGNIQALTQELDQWHQTAEILEQITFENESGKKEDSPLVISVAQWLERFQILLFEQQHLHRSQEEWAQTWPAIQPTQELISTLEPESLEARKSELASVWFDRISEVYKSAIPLRELFEDLKKIHESWTENWKKIDPEGIYPSPALSIDKHPLYRAMISLEDLVRNHEHAMAGAGLFQQQDPVQTLRKTIHIMDNLYDGWMIWQDGSTRLNFNLFDGEIFRQVHQRDFLNQCLTATLLLSITEEIPGPVKVDGAEGVPPDLLEQLSHLKTWVFSSLYPLPVPGNHLWVTTPSSRKKSWEALPFATR